MQMMSLDGIKMKVVETAANGVVNQDTVFTFEQVGTSVYATYAGGKIEKGFLVGKRDGKHVTFSYCQLQIDGVLDEGRSHAELERATNSKLRLVERFEWKSRPGETGTNIFEAF